ncbi:MAG: hypothetical protein LYZ69_02955 [Nitrososphaerales archaeon]|nr:hypothetical protein [Nitrososphaerales archaeon]
MEGTIIGVFGSDSQMKTAFETSLAKKGEAKDLEKSHWLDDGTTQLTDRLRIDFRRSPFYKQSVVGRDLHLQLPGEMLTAAITQGQSDGEITVKLPTQVPVWPGMRVAVIDLNGKNLRVAGGGSCKA